jgi:hypothetical protein
MRDRHKAISFIGCSNDLIALGYVGARPPPARRVVTDLVAADDSGVDGEVAPRAIRVGENFAGGRRLNLPERGRRSFVNTAWAPMNTSSSTSYPSNNRASALILS